MAEATSSIYFLEYCDFPQLAWLLQRLRQKKKKNKKPLNANWVIKEPLSGYDLCTSRIIQHKLARLEDCSAELNVASYPGPLNRPGYEAKLNGEVIDYSVYN